MRRSLLAGNEIVSPTDEIVSPTDWEALDVRSQKAALEEFNHSLVFTTADLGERSVRRKMKLSRPLMGKHSTPFTKSCTRGIQPLACFDDS